MTEPKGSFILPTRGSLGGFQCASCGGRSLEVAILFELVRQVDEEHAEIPVMVRCASCSNYIAQRGVYPVRLDREPES